MDSNDHELTSGDARLNMMLGTKDTQHISDNSMLKSRTPPPGFSSSQERERILNESALDETNRTLLYGESIRKCGTLSAPPPGFANSTSSSNYMKIRQGWSDNGSSSHLFSDQNSKLSSNVSGYTQKLEKFDAYVDDKQRTKSYVNLAAALGEGLAEVIDESCKEEKNKVKIISYRDPRMYSHPSGGEPNHSLKSEITKLARENHVSSLIGIPSESSSHDINHARKTITPSPIGIYQHNRNTSSDPKEDSLDKAFEDQLPIGVSSRSNTPSLVYSPLPKTLSVQQRTSGQSIFPSRSDNFLSETAGDLLRGDISSSNFPSFHRTSTTHEQGGRSSAPPNYSSLIDLPSHIPNHRVASPRSLRNALSATSSPIGTPEPMFNYSSNVASDSNYALTETELTPFLHDTTATGNSGLSRSQSKSYRGIAIFGMAHVLAIEKNYISDIRATCEAFGVIDSFRSDFALSKDVIFISYFDLRSAEHAAAELVGHLNRISRDGYGHQNLSYNHQSSLIKVKYCIPLNSSTNTDDSLILLSNMPQEIDEDRLTSMMQSYGAVKTVQYQMQGNKGMNYGDNSRTDDQHLEDERIAYTVEFFDIQDAKYALLELINSQPWGPEIKVQKGMRNPTMRRKGKELLMLIGRWRHGHTTTTGAAAKDGTFTPPPCTSTPPPLSSVAESGSETNSTSTAAAAITNNPSSRSSSPGLSNSSIYENKSNVYDDHHAANKSSEKSLHHASANNAPPPHAQLVLSPDGQYTYVMVNPSIHSQQRLMQQQPTHHPPHLQPPHLSHPGQHPHSATSHYGAAPPHYWNSGVPATTATLAAAAHAHHYPQGAHVVIAHHPHGHHHHVVGGPPPPYVTTTTATIDSNGKHGVTYNTVARNGIRTVIPNSNDTPMMKKMNQHHYQGGGVAGSNFNANNGMKHRQGGGGGAGEGMDENLHLSLDINLVQNGTDKRTSLMVRNIPNKYTQKMLLSEFSEFGHGSDKIDFFYLPIDFKNRCNRGYAFVNFVDYKDICSFHKQYNGKHWRVFNSDKICAITYARIQGKAAMLKRFEHSALLDKNDEYRPLVFTSHGAKKGMRETFSAAAQAASNSNNNDGGGDSEK